MSAPGKNYREAISLVELFQMFPDDATAERWFEEQRWGAADAPAHCPMCGGADKLSHVPKRKSAPYWCGDCRSNFSVRTGTVMHRSKIGLQKWAIAVYLWSVSLKGVSSMRLHRDLNITQKTAWFMAQRLREAWSDVESGMAGPVEVDETSVGGKEKSKHAKKKLRGRPRGRGQDGGRRDQGPRHGDRQRKGRQDAETLQGFVMDSAAKDATVYTDDHAAYRGIPFDHETVNHSVGEYVNEMAHTQGIESFWATLKRGYHGTFHHISPKHLHRYVNEFATRHNMRRQDTEVMMSETAARMIGKRLTYKGLIADNGLESGARPRANP